MKIAIFIMLICLLNPVYAKWDNLTTLKVAVTDPSAAIGNEKLDPRAFGDALQNRLVNQKAFLIVERSFLNKVLDEQKLEMSGLTENNAAKVGQLSGADKILVSSLTKVDKVYQLTVKGIDVKTGLVELSDSVSGKTLAEILTKVPALADRLLATAKGSFSSRESAGQLQNKDGLTLNLPLNKNAQDISGFDNHGLLKNVLPATNRFGEPKSAMLFKDAINYVATEKAITNPFPLTLSIWFKTDAPTGGRILGFSDNTDGMSTTKDRHIYMDRNGRILFGVIDSQDNFRAIRSPLSYNDDGWHQAAAVFSTKGIYLYLDAELVSSNTAVTNPYPYTGFWRVSYDTLNQWPGEPDTYSFHGCLDDVMIFNRGLSSDEIQSIYHEGGWE